MRRASAGVALSELLVALAVLLPVAVVTVGLFPYAHVLDRRAWALSHAENVARSRLEGLRTRAFEDLPAREDFAESRDGLSFAGTVATAPEGAVPADLLRRATVTVRWNTGRAEELTLTTLLANTDRGRGP